MTVEMIQEPRDVRLKRLGMRSMRRGIKEMDLLLSSYADRNLSAMTDTQLDLYEELLDENDQDLLSWSTGQHPTPGRFSDLISEIVQAHHATIGRAGTD